MIIAVKCLFVVVACSLMLGCADRDMVPDDVDMESIHAPSAPKKTDYVATTVSADYRTGMWMYRQSLIAYVGRLTEYINVISDTEGFTDWQGNPCRFPYAWSPIVLPETPAPITTDPEVVNGILANHVRELRRLIRDTNARYAPCVK